jgi:hypothetical protein
MRMKKPIIFVGIGLAIVMIIGLGVWLSRPSAVSGPAGQAVQKGSSTSVDVSEGLANEEVLLIEGGTATSENFMMVTNPPKK